MSTTSLPASAHRQNDTLAHWGGRAFLLVMIVGGWLLNAHGMENRRMADELRARGHTTLAKDPFKNPLDRSKEPRQFGLFPTKAYLYVVDGVEYRHTTSASFFREEIDPIGKTVTYLPEDPNVHQVGDIRPKEGVPLWVVCGMLIVAVLFGGGLTLGFFLSALTSTVETDPTRLGWWFIWVLSVTQVAIALGTTTFFRVPFLILLTQYVPAFVGGTVAAIVAVRLFAWGAGLALQKPAVGSAGTPASRYEPTVPANSDAEFGGNVANSAHPAPKRAWTNHACEPLVEEEPIPVEANPHAVKHPEVLPTGGVIIACPICATFFAVVPDGSGFITCPHGHWFTPDCAGSAQNTNTNQKAAPRVIEAPEPRYYYVTREPGRDFVGMFILDEIRGQLATGTLLGSFHATQSDGRSFNQFQRDGGGVRWRTLADLLGERGETLPDLAPTVPWHVTPCAALAGAISCLLVASGTFLIMHVVGFLCLLAGATWSWVAFQTSTESILGELIITSIATAFGAIRGDIHAGTPPNYRKTYAEIAGKAASDLCSIRATSGPFEVTFGRLVCLFMAMLLAAPVIVVLLLVWFR